MGGEGSKRRGVVYRRASASICEKHWTPRAFQLRSVRAAVFDEREPESLRGYGMRGLRLISNTTAADETLRIFLLSRLKGTSRGPPRCPGNGPFLHAHRRGWRYLGAPRGHTLS